MTEYEEELGKINYAVHLSNNIFFQLLYSVLQGCSMTRSFKKIVITTHDRKLCLFCYEICNIQNFEVELQELKELEPEDLCECDHEGY